MQSQEGVKETARTLKLLVLSGGDGRDARLAVLQDSFGLDTLGF